MLQTLFLDNYSRLMATCQFIAGFNTARDGHYHNPTIKAGRGLQCIHSAIYGLSLWCSILCPFMNTANNRKLLESARVNSARRVVP